MRQTTVKFIARGFVDVFQVDSSWGQSTDTIIIIHRV